MQRALFASVVVLLAAGAAACGSDAMKPVFIQTTPPTVAPVMSILRSGEGLLYQGKGGAFGMAIKRVGFSSDVALSVEGVPEGVSTVLWPGSTLPAASTNFSVEFTLAPTAPPGVYPVTVRAKAAGLPDSTATIKLTVAEAPFLITSPYTALTLPAGSETIVYVGISRQAFNRVPVTVSLEGGVTGDTAVPASITTTDDLAVFTLKAASGASGGGTVLVRGTVGDSWTEQARYFTINVK